MLYTGAMVCATALEKNISTMNAVIKEYKENLIPKLKEVLLQQDEEKYQELIKDYFN